MGGKPRQKPKRMAEKLVRIRAALGLSQNEMIKRLGMEGRLKQNRISGYELGTNEPSVITLLRYARAAGVNMEVLADDELDLPEILPGPTDHAEIKRTFAARRKAKR